MEILLIHSTNSDFTSKVFDSIFESGMEMIPLGLLYIATVLEKNGFEVRILDLTVYKDNNLILEKIDEMLGLKPRLIGISAYTASYPSGKKIAKIAREKLGRDAIIVWGGHHVTFLPEEPLLEDLADIVVRGEGEFAMLKIAESIIRKRNDEWKNTEAVSYMDHGEIRHNSPALYRIMDIDSLPVPGRHFVNMNDYRNPGSIASSRGCVARCLFCAAGAFGPIAMRNVESVFDEIMMLYNNYGHRLISFVDNNFTAHKRRVAEILSRVKEAGLRIQFYLESRATNDGDFIKFLAQNDVFAIHFGIESGNSEVIKDIRKKIALDTVLEGIDMCLQHGLKVSCSFIIGHPFDTVKTINDTINLALQLSRKGVTCYFAPLTPFPGTEVYNKREELGVKIIDNDFSHWDLRNVVIKTKWLSKKDIVRMLQDAYAKINAL